MKDGEFKQDGQLMHDLVHRVKFERFVPDLYVLDVDKINGIEDVKLILGAMNITSHEGNTGFETIKHLFKKA